MQTKLLELNIQNKQKHFFIWTCNETGWINSTLGLIAASSRKIRVTFTTRICIPGSKFEHVSMRTFFHFPKIIFLQAGLESSEILIFLSCSFVLDEDLLIKKPTHSEETNWRWLIGSKWKMINSCTNEQCAAFSPYTSSKFVRCHETASKLIAFLDYFCLCWRRSQ